MVMHRGQTAPFLYSSKLVHFGSLQGQVRLISKKFSMMRMKLMPTPHPGFEVQINKDVHI